MASDGPPEKLEREGDRRASSIAQTLPQGTTVSAMASDLRKSGIGSVGDIPWGTHFCHFYENKKDLLDVLIPYCKTGLEQNEFCVWGIFDPLDEQEARHALERDWESKLDQALAIDAYEDELSGLVANRRIVLLCAYPLAVNHAAEILDAGYTRRFAIARRQNGGADGTSVLKDLKEVGSNISRIADELQTSVMSIRMLPVKTVFQKFPRLVRDLARSQGKEVQLVIDGEGIELDKTILEQIGDPLVHVIRNSVDHGLEPREERLASGKEASGHLTLGAFHEEGGVAIEVTDDGRGLDVGALQRKAVEEGLVTLEAANGMSDEAAFQLIFLPGLSTAAKVTDVSGRGVGMDVVRSNVRNLQGTVEIQSKAGRGTN